MSDEGELDDHVMDQFSWDDQVVPDLSQMNVNDPDLDQSMHPDTAHTSHLTSTPMTRHVDTPQASHPTSTPMTRHQHVSFDSGYQSSPNMASRGVLPTTDAEFEDVFVDDTNNLADSITANRTADGDSDRESIGRLETENEVEATRVQFEDETSQELSLDAYQGRHDKNELAISDINNTALPLRSRASEPAFVTSPTECYAGARPKTYQQTSQSIPVRQSHLQALQTVADGIPLSPNTRTNIFNQLGHSYGTPPRAYPFTRPGNHAQGSLMSQFTRAHNDLSSVGHDVREGLGNALEHQQRQFIQGQQQVQSKEELHPEHRPRYHSVITPPDLSQLNVDSNHSLSTPANGLLRSRQRSNSAPAVMTIERAFGRELRRISDEFDEEHQTTTRRTRSRGRRGSLLSYQPIKRANHRLSFPGAEGQDVGWWQHIVQWIPIPGLSGSPMSRHRTEPFEITGHVSEEDESNASDDAKSEQNVDDELAGDQQLDVSHSPDSEIQFTLGPEESAAELERRDSTISDSPIAFTAAQGEDFYVRDDESSAKHADTTGQENDNNLDAIDTE